MNQQENFTNISLLKKMLLLVPVHWLYENNFIVIKQTSRNILLGLFIHFSDTVFSRNQRNNTAHELNFCVRSPTNDKRRISSSTSLAPSSCTLYTPGVTPSCPRPSCFSFVGTQFNLILIFFNLRFIFFENTKKDQLKTADLRFAWQRPTLTGGDPQLPSALKSLTSVFGMGTGVTSLPSSPDIYKELRSFKTR